MYCSKCGKEIAETSIFCSFCGHQIITQPQPIPAPQTSVATPATGTLFPGVKKSSWFIVFIISAISGFISIPVWFLIRREALNNLNSKEKLAKGIFIFTIILFSLSLIFTLLSGVLLLGEASSTEALPAILFYKYVSTFMSVLGGIITLVQSFKVRRVLMEHLATSPDKHLNISAFWTLLFQIFYLQYKINEN